MQNDLDPKGLLAGLEALTPGWAGAMVAAFSSRKRRYTDFGNDGAEQDADLVSAKWLADNLPAIRRHLSAVPDGEGELVERLFQSVAPFIEGTAWREARAALAAALVRADQAHSTIAALRAEVEHWRGEARRLLKSGQEALDAAETAESEVKRLTEALENIDSLIPKPSIPLTHMIKAILDATLNSREKAE